MARPSSFLYLWVFLASLGGVLVLTPLVRRFAERLGVVDSPSSRKAHLEPVSLLGGIGIYGGAFVAAWALVPGARAELKGFFLAGFVILVFGIQDDISPMDPWVKFLAQVAGALVLVGFGVQVLLTGSAVLDVVLSVAWTVGVINALNYQDNMDGLCAGISAVSALGLFVLAVTSEQYLVAVLSLCLAGGALGFLRMNYPKARIFMGDAGSMFLGFVLAFLGIRLRFLDQPRSSTFVLPALVLAVPLFDAALVTISRLRRGISPAQAGTDHTSHRLARLGMPAWAAVAVMWVAQALLCLGALAVSRHPRPVKIAVVVVVAVAGLVGLVLLERPSVTDELPHGDRKHQAA